MNEQPVVCVSVQCGIVVSWCVYYVVYHQTLNANYLP